jgi:hypothetical protein
MKETQKNEKDQHPVELKVGDEVGKFRLNKVLVDRNTSFETASYWEETTIEPGVYPIKVGLDHNKEIYLYASLKGKISDNYFPSSFGGHIISEPKKTGIGNERNIGKNVPFLKAIERTGVTPNKPGDGDDFYIDPKYWEPLAEIAKERLAKNLNGLDYFRKKMDVSGIKTFSSYVSSSAEILLAVERLIEYHKKDSFKKNHLENWAWAKEDKKDKEIKTPSPKKPQNESPEM